VGGIHPARLALGVFFSTAAPAARLHRRAPQQLGEDRDYLNALVFDTVAEAFLA